MKGLLLKDTYMLWKVGKMYFLFIIIFFISSISTQNAFLMIFPCFYASMMPYMLYSLDEKSRFLSYCDTLPCSRAIYVAEKYLFNLLMILICLLLDLLMAVICSVAESVIPFLIFTVPLYGVLPHALIMPFMFKFGSEKGRLWYILIIAAIGGIGGACMGNLLDSAAHIPELPSFLPALIFPAAALFYILSWYLSVVFYQKREL